MFKTQYGKSWWVDGATNTAAGRCVFITVMLSSPEIHFHAFTLSNNKLAPFHGSRWHLIWCRDTFCFNHLSIKSSRLFYEVHLGSRCLISQSGATGGSNWASAGAGPANQRPLAHKHQQSLEGSDWTGSAWGGMGHGNGLQNPNFRWNVHWLRCRALFHSYELFLNSFSDILHPNKPCCLCSHLSLNPLVTSPTWTP